MHERQEMILAIKSETNFLVEKTNQKVLFELDRAKNDLEMKKQEI